ncbi:MAG: hypothetical protein ACRDYE_01890 [Acidimicrobiales bacterium]
MSVDLGERFARTVAAQDADALKELLAPNVSFRALTPGRCWESHDAAAVVDDVILGTWFSPEHSITRILKVDCTTVGIVDRVGYRFRATLPDGDFIVEQQAYLRAENDKISWLRILCSGFVHDE